MIMVRSRGFFILDLEALEAMIGDGVLTDGRVGWLVGFQKARVSPPKMVEDGR